jgi:signal transduction histidine kinase
MESPISWLPPRALRWRHIGNILVRLTVCTVVVLVLTAVLYTVPLSDRSLTAALTFLFMILVVSAVWGFRYSVFVSALTTLAFSWLLPPVGVFWLDDPRDVFTLAAFLAIGIITSHLSDRAHKERERLRQQEADLAHFSRLTMMGELAASLAHEIKQPIASAIMNAQTCSRWLHQDPPNLPEALDAASALQSDATRAADIIDRVGSLYRRDAPLRELIDLNKMIREMTVLLGDVANRNSISIRPS